jgi:hypothetical protein
MTLMDVKDPINQSDGVVLLFNSDDKERKDNEITYNRNLFQQLGRGLGNGMRQGRCGMGVRHKKKI